MANNVRLKSQVLSHMALDVKITPSVYKCYAFAVIPTYRDSMALTVSEADLRSLKAMLNEMFPEVEEED